MIKTYITACHLSRTEADALNRASGQIYTQILVTHWRIYRKKGKWLAPFTAQKLNDWYRQADPRLLHAFSVDGAQQAFYKACKTTHALRKQGLETKFPYKRKYYRTTIWYSNGIRAKDDHLLLARARGQPPIRVPLATYLRGRWDIREVRLVYDRSSRRYFWHLVGEDGQQPKLAPGPNVVAIDLGEVHPAAISNGQTTVVVTCRELRSQRQYTNKRLAELHARQAKGTRGSRLWKRLQKRISRFLYQQAKRTRDMEHKISREVVKVACEQQAGTMVIGDVRKVADKVKLGKKTNQKVSNWAHGKLRQYLTYKAAAEGIETKLVNEAYTSQTCPKCGERHKPHGRWYTCRQCGFSGHRDGVGAVNILSVYQYGQPGKITPTGSTTYRLPFRRLRRSPLDTGHVACGQPQEAPTQ